LRRDVGQRRRRSGLLNYPQEENPKYEAISYCWGSKDDPSYVCVADGKRIFIRRNLDDALRRFRFEHTTRVLWTDALCINQDSTDEKNRQVAIMGEIYSRAKCVLIWIGPEEDESEKALDIMQHLSDRVYFNWYDVTLHPLIQYKKEDMHWADRRVALPYKDGQLTAVLNLFIRPYFSRTWIRQETVLAKVATLHCGGRMMRWDHFRTAAACLFSKPIYPSAFLNDSSTDFTIASRQIFDLCNSSSVNITYSVLRRYTGGTGCFDPRDKIYGALSMLSIENRDLGVTPDYFRGEEELYTDVARRVILHGKSLELFSTCVLSSTGMQLPSWVPDWSSPMPTSSMIIPAWSACGWISGQNLVPHARSLCVAGVVVAHITSFEYISYDVYQPASVFAILRKLKPNPEQPATDSSTGRRWIDTFIMALLWNGVAEAFWPRRMDKPTLEQWTKALNVVWNSSMGYDAIDVETKTDIDPALRECFVNWRGLCLFNATNEFIGTAYPSVQEGDIVCVLIGCKWPVVLRQVLNASSEVTWKVVCICSVPGLMFGEFIYGVKLPSTYQPVRIIKYDVSQPIDGWPIAMLNLATDTLKNDPAKILTEMGIKVKSYQRKPHRLEVLPETLRAAGIQLQDFTLV
jgi:hypothetical protein